MTRAAVSWERELFITMGFFDMTHHYTDDRIGHCPACLSAAGQYVNWLFNYQPYS
jgi:hypothetical protein